jgi:cytoskeletal protein CcmA (bactofilin family)
VLTKFEGGQDVATGDNDGAVNATTIGPTIIIKGRLKVHEDLTVKGRIDAEITSSKALIIEGSGIVKADVRVQSAKISGVLIGNITAEEKIEIAADGRVVGNLRAPRILIRDGGAFRGKIEMQGLEEEQLSEPDVLPTSTPAAVAAPVPAVIPPLDTVALPRSARMAPKPARKH